jgi:hypothetical protein
MLDSRISTKMSSVTRLLTSEIRQPAQISLGQHAARLDNPALAADPPAYRHSPALRGSRHLPVGIDGISTLRYRARPLQANRTV